MKYKRILITCGNGGIASGIKQKLVSEGSEVKTTYRSGTGDFKLDFFSKDSINQCINAIADADVTFDALAFVIPRLAPSSEVFPTPEKWAETFERYFINPLYFLEKLIDIRALNPGASVVMVGGISSKQALTGYAVNNTIRLAWVGQFKTMALALAPDYKFNSVSLGGVLTDTYIEKLGHKATQNGHGFDEQMQIETQNVPLKKYASIEEVANVVVPLLGAFSDHMTGQNIVLDGGFIKTYS